MTELIDNALPLADVAYSRLRDDIICCRLQPGQRITERGLAKEMRLGISPIRDALTRLDHDGLVRTVPRKGYQVTPLTLKAVDDLFAFWLIIGPEVVRLGVAAATDEQLDRTIKNLNAIERIDMSQRDSSKLLRIIELGNDLFTVLAQASANTYLAAAYAKLSGEIFRVWTLVSDSDLITPAKLADITDWSEVIRRRDAEGLADCARAYIRACNENIAQTLVRWPSVMESEVVPFVRPRH